MTAVVRCAFAHVPQGAVVDVLALAIAGQGRSLVSYGGRAVRVPNEAYLSLA